MNLYHSLNEMMEYIEQHLEEEIHMDELAHFLGVNEYTMQKLFSLLCGISLTEYIRKRRLSNAGADLYQTKEKLIDIAFKYQYENPTSFSRAFEKFHGIKPSQVKDHPENLKLFAKLVFQEDVPKTPNIEYSIEKRGPLVLYGKGISTTESTIGQDAPRFFQEMLQQYDTRFGFFDYGMTVYKNRFIDDQFEYWVLYEKEVPSLIRYEIPASNWLIFRIPSQEAKDIQETTHQFYLSFAPSCRYTLRDLPELEHYHDSITDFMIPIEDPST